MTPTTPQGADAEMPPLFHRIRRMAYKRQSDDLSPAELSAYLRGHDDARKAAADLVAASVSAQVNAEPVLILRDIPAECAGAVRVAAALCERNDYLACASTLTEIASQMQAQITAPEPITPASVVCDYCGGDGAHHQQRGQYTTCTACDGTGKRTTPASQAVSGEAVSDTMLAAAQDEANRQGWSILEMDFTAILQAALNAGLATNAAAQASTDAMTAVVQSCTPGLGVVELKLSGYVLDWLDPGCTVIVSAPAAPDTKGAM